MSNKNKENKTINFDNCAPRDRVSEYKKVYAKLFGSVPNFDNETDHEFMEILRRFIFGDVFNGHAELDFKMRELITVTVLATLQTLPQLEAHTAGALNAGATPIEIREAIYQLAPFIGFPRTLNAIASMNKIFVARGIKLPLENTGTTTDETRFSAGYAIQNPIYGSEIAEKYPDIPEIPQYLTEFGFGDFYTRKGLDIKTRELLILVVLTVIRSDNQIKAHVIGNLKVGNSKDIMIATMLQTLPYVGFPNVLNTINIIKETVK